MVLSLIPLPYKLAAVAIAALALFGFGYWKGYQNEHDKFVTFKSAVEQAQEQIRIENERKLAALNDLSDRYERDLRSAHVALADKRVRVSNNCGQGGVQAVPAHAGGLAQLPQQESGLGSGRSITAQECEKRINWAVEDAAMIEWYKSWDIDRIEATQ